MDLVRLVALGWDPKTAVFTPDPTHRLLGYTVCPDGCGNEADRAGGLCVTCASHRQTALESGVGPGARNRGRAVAGAEQLCLVCRMPGACRPAAVHGLCLACNQLRAARRQSVETFLDGDLVVAPALPRPGYGDCSVVACVRLAAHPNRLCHAHHQAWRRAGHPQLETFCQRAAPLRGGRGGRVELSGLSDQLLAEVLYGIQASVAEGRQLAPGTLRTVADHLRQLGTNNLSLVPTSGLSGSARRFVVFSVDRLRLVFMEHDEEYAKDVWDLRAWGRRGRLSFAGGGSLGHGPRQTVRPITQSWLKAAAKAWAGEALVSSEPGGIRQVIAAVGLLSESLARRPDGGEDLRVLARADIAAFLAHLQRLERASRLTTGQRRLSVVRTAQFLRECREMGLTQPDGLLAGLPEQVALRRADHPRAPRSERDQVGRALPQVVLTQLLEAENLGLLEAMYGPSVRAALELLAGVGRRTAELCSLGFACLDYDSHLGDDGVERRSPVLVHDMPKAGKFACRLPIHDRDAAIISAQQRRVRAAFPATPVERLVLFPRSQMNPGGTQAFGPGFFQRAMRSWVDALPRLDGPERYSSGGPVPFPRELVFPYVFRHGFAQRHADAGTPVDTLRELMGHQQVRTTLGYYRVTARRKRAAQDALGPLQLDATAHLVRPGLTRLDEAEVLREQRGELAVPFGVCTEPTNVAADGGSCPFRHRCMGCEYFRTDPSYQPELAAYLGQLLVDKERLDSTVPQLVEWARADAAPCEQEIEAVRRLVRANTEVLAGLEDDQREGIEYAIAMVRAGRAALAEGFPVELRGLARQARPTLFPTIERASLKEASSG